VDKTPPPASGDEPEKRETWTYDESAGSAPRVETSSLEPGSTFHRYFILDRVGEGGMGVVYAAYDPRLDRRVALKFLARRSAGRDDIRDQRLLREAQAMARLSHPNVAVVYEVEVVDGRPFLSMEFVDGVDLGEWLAEKRRSFDEVLEVFRGAGRGLAAAHAARIIHRDFKPGNVVLDRHDRPRVTDFGLSRAALEPGDVESDAKGEPGATVLSSPSHLSTPITGTGAVVGTFSYMSPEQHAGGVVDARSDQFSFCVALYEAVYGEHPFGGGLERGEEAKAWTVAPAPAGSSVPRWCRQALLRGLAEAPDDRFPSMDALLAALSPHRVSRRWQLAAGIAIAVILPAAFAFALSRDSSDGVAAPRCDLGVQKLAGAWDPARKQKLREVFARSGAPGADTTWLAFSEILDQRAGAWAAMHNQACAATHVDGVQSPAVLDLRMECLGRRRQEMKDLVDVYADAPDAKSLDRAVRAADRLSTVSSCANVATLRAVVPLPDDPATLVAVQSIRERLSRSLALYEAGRYKQGREYMEALKKEADATGYGPVMAEAGQALARHISQVEPDEAEKVLLDAAKQAVKAQDWALEAEILISLLANYGRAGRVPESLVAARVAELAVERARGDDALRGRLAMNTGSAELNASLTQDALRHHRLAQELSRKALGARSPAVARARKNTGTALLNLGRTREALVELEGALAIQKATLRPDHPDIADTLDSLGQGYINLGLLRKARDTALAALAIRREELGPENALTTYSLEQTANAEARLGNFQRAFALYESLLATQKKVLDERDVFFASTYLSLGDAQRRAGQLDRAERNLRAAVDQCARAGTPEHGNAGHALASLGLLHNSRGNYAFALRDCRKALDLLSRTEGPDSSYLIETRECLGEALIGTGDVKAARAELERALTPQVEQDTGPQWMAGARFQLARALWASGEKRRGREVARAAVASLVAAEGDNRATIERIEKWLAEHGESPAR
jgi:eukaryotic-like serine/threonine-protein kinase